jgi:hypothetical protein
MCTCNKWQYIINRKNNRCTTLITPVSMLPHTWGATVQLDGTYASCFNLHAMATIFDANIDIVSIYMLLIIRHPSRAWPIISTNDGENALQPKHAACVITFSCLARSFRSFIRSTVAPYHRTTPTTVRRRRQLMQPYAVMLFLQNLRHCIYPKGSV